MVTLIWRTDFCISAVGGLDKFFFVVCVNVCMHVMCTIVVSVLLRFREDGKVTAGMQIGV